MRTSIREIIMGIPKGKTFDSHTIIDRLFKNYSDVLYKYIRKYATGNKPTLVVHGNIGKEIARFEKVRLIERRSKAQSANIHDNLSENTSWVKL